MYEGLFVYTSPFANRTPYISVLMSSVEFQLPNQKKMATIIGLTDLVTRGARTNTAILLLYSTPLLPFRESNGQ